MSGRVKGVHRLYDHLPLYWLTDLPAHRIAVRTSNNGKLYRGSCLLETVQIFWLVGLTLLNTNLQ
jgi:hypothetical protein